MRFREISLFCCIAAESAVAYTALALLLAPTAVDAAWSALLAPALYVAAFFTQRLLARSGLSFWLRWPIAVFCGVLASLLTVKLLFFAPDALGQTAWLIAPWRDFLNILNAFPYALLLFLAAAIIWMRGAWLASRPFSMRTAVVSFQFGSALLLLLYGLAALLQRNVASSALVTSAFFFSALLGLALAHRRRLTAAESTARDLQWLWLLLISVALAMIVGVLVGVFFDDRAIALLLAPVRWIGSLLGALLDLLAKLTPRPASTALPELGPMAIQPQTPRDEPFMFQIPERLRQAMRIIWGVPMAALLLLAIYRLVSEFVQHLMRVTGVGDALVESVPGGWLADLRALCHAIWRSLLRVVESAQFALYRRRLRRLPAQSPLSGAVRDTYRDLLYWTAKRGLARAGRETPYEYLHRLVAALPAGATDLTVLTECYVQARYGPHRVCEGDRVAVAESWRRLRLLLRR